MTAARHYTAGMKLLLILLVWLVMAAILTAGILMAVGGKVWLLVLATVAYIVMFGKFGCLSSH